MSLNNTRKIGVSIDTNVVGILEDLIFPNGSMQKSMKDQMGAAKKLLYYMTCGKMTVHILPLVNFEINPDMPHS